MADKKLPGGKTKAAWDYAADPKRMAKAQAAWEAYDAESPELSLTFELSWVHDAAKRPRFTRVGGGRVYDPGAKEKKKIRKAVADMLPEGWVPAAGQVGLELDYYIPARSDSTVTQLILARFGLVRPTHKPDANNLVKEFEDACNGLLWEDDSQVVEETVRKWYSIVEGEDEGSPRDDPRAVFTVTFRQNQFR
jgi:Holliday junction resolvase RusA-like endonuclease